MLLTPEGLPAGNRDPIMLLAEWASYLKNPKNTPPQTKMPMIAAGMGKPTFPINTKATQAAIQYWSDLNTNSTQARHSIFSKKTNSPKDRDAIVKLNSASNYGDPQGELIPRQTMAHALTQWYQNVPFEAKDVLFTVGGAGALHNIFEMLNRLHPDCRIITPLPYYTLYKGAHNKNRLFPIHVMKSPGYRLTAQALELAIQQAMNLGQEDGGMPKAFLFCDPNNPLGTMIPQDEVEKIAEVLRKHKDLIIILDEAYAEMPINGNTHHSLLKVAPDLKDRIILLRSATKALSGAGERMAIIATCNPELMNELVKENISICGHAPKSLQVAFSKAMSGLDESELAHFSNHYKPQVELVFEGLKRIGASMPDPNYRPEGTFYTLADLSDLIGTPVPEEAKKALGNTKTIIETDEDICYSLLFKDGIMIAPLSYFGIDEKSGYLRITCSTGDTELKELINRLESRLKEARIFKYDQIKSALLTLIEEIQQKHLSIPDRFYSDSYPKIKARFVENHTNANDTDGKISTADQLFLEIKRILEGKTCADYSASKLKEINHGLEMLLISLREHIIEENKPKNKIKRNSIIVENPQKIKKPTLDLDCKKIINKAWKRAVHNSTTSPEVQKMLLNLPASKRLTFQKWTLFLQQSNINNLRDFINNAPSLISPNPS